MATQLDLQEQEQLDALKAFWNKQGNLITWASVSASPGRCSSQSRRPSRASKACTARSTPITKTRSPATSGGVTTLEGRRLRQSSRPPSKVTTSLPRVTTLVKRPSLPTPADKAPPALARQSTVPLSACRASTSPSPEAT